MKISALFTSVFFKKKFCKNDKIDVLFFVFHHPVWKLDEVYKRFNNDLRFNPVVILCPYITQGDNVMSSTMDTAYQYFTDKGFQVTKTKGDDGWLDINMHYKNKIIFFTNPHNITFKKYQWSNFKRDIKFYVPYHHQIEAGQWDSQWNSAFHLSMSKLFYIAPFHKDLAKEKMLNHGINVSITGYPATEGFLLNKHLSGAAWKKQENKKLKVIFSPHHTIEYSPNIGLCEFLNVADKMKALSNSYKKQIQFSFKPHPILKEKLASIPSWGREKVDEYYRYWEESSNTQLDEGEYFDLFSNSDAMIHDSGSFLAEYLYVNKPVMYLYNNTTRSRFNDYGLKCLECCHVDKNNDIESFLFDLIQNKDCKKEKREDFINKNLNNEFDLLPSLKIYNEVCDELFNLS
jgi:hypothetical protein